ncbi:MAG TPA: FadR/GntR family transcriptional regulator [Acetobacteraceae bacterium]|nr:FadR/GntR family transcriptional regulator [Acetobacteraceae bacterium]
MASGAATVRATQPSAALDAGASSGPAHERPRRLYQEIARRIDAMIQDGLYQIGDRLPAERELAQRLGVSRPSTREAVIALEVAGVVEVRTGSGIYVRLAGPSGHDHLQRFLAGDPGPGPYEALEVRRLLEGEAAFRAAVNVSTGELGELRATLAAMRDDPRPVPRRGDAADRAFHLLIAAASGNSVLAMLIGALWDTRALPLWRRWMERTRTAAMHLERVREHERIIDCLAARDAIGARREMQQHIDQVSRRFAQG